MSRETGGRRRLGLASWTALNYLVGWGAGHGAAKSTAAGWICAIVGICLTWIVILCPLPVSGRNDDDA